MGLLDGKVSIVTGGSRGVGAATVRAYVNEGAKVVAADIVESRLEKLAADFGNDVLAVACDISKEEDWDRLVTTTIGEFGQIDVLANIAAVMYMGLIVDTPLDEFMRVLTVNAAGTFLGIRAVVPTMMAARQGIIINYSSLGVFSVTPTISAYLASKQAVRGLTHSAAMELIPYGVRVNAVCGPGGNSDFTREAPKSSAMTERLSGLGGLSDPAAAERLRQHFESMAVEPPSHENTGWAHRSVPTMVFLASDMSLGYNGADFVLDGGSSIGTTEIPG
jgi:3alpha(or 20beta)-hydroxysteroid dehydrogenase